MRSHRFSMPVERLALTASDGVPLVGVQLGFADPSIVFCHGFMGWHRKPRVGRFIELLSRWFSVYAFDLRGHGRSGGVCTFGDKEILDVEAVLDLARLDGHSKVATLGASMGGIAVIRHSALLGGADAVVSVSTPARWEGHRSEAIRRMEWFTTSPNGRRLSRAAGVRLTDEWHEPEAPEDVVEKIAPTPVIVVHGRDDHYFEEEEAWRLYRRAAQPKRLLLATRFGHGEDGFTPAFAERLARLLYQTWGLEWLG
jgi:uncharacterized protein